MKKKNQIIYKDFLKNKKIYNLNKGYWTRTLKSKLDLKFNQESKQYELNKDLHYDGNPIFLYYDSSIKRSIRILQDEFEPDKDIELKAMDIWWNNIESTDSNTDELVIALFLFSETVNLTIDLSRLWLKELVNQEEIEKIYISRISRINLNEVTY